MKKLNKLTIVSLLIVGLAITLLFVSCGKKEEVSTITAPTEVTPVSTAPAEVKATDGKWSWENSGMSIQLKLKDDNTFYMSIFFDSNAKAGTYEILNEKTNYFKIEEGAAPSETDEDKSEYTADQMLVMRAYDGSVMTAAYADGVLWNCNVGMGTRTLRQDASFNWDESAEVSVEAVKASLPKDEISNLVLNHDKTFFDQIDGYTEGSWKQTDKGFDLFDGSKAHASIESIGNGNYTYTPNGGNTITLYKEVWTPENTFKAEEVEVTLKGKSAEKVNFTLDLWQDGSADITMTDSSFKMQTIASGTWVATESGDIDFDIASQNLTATPDSKGAVNVAIALEDAFETEVIVEFKSTATVYEGLALSANASASAVKIATVQMTANDDGTYKVTGTVDSPMGNRAVEFVYGSYDENYNYNYKNSSSEDKVAETFLDENGNVAIKFENVSMTVIGLGAAFPTEEVVIVLGNTWNYLALADYAANATKVSSDFAWASFDKAYLFMKDGKFEVAVNYTAMGANATGQGLSGTYSEVGGNIVFTSGDTTFTSTNNQIEMTFKMMGAADVTAVFPIEK